MRKNTKDSRSSNDSFISLKQKELLARRILPVGTEVLPGILSSCTIDADSADYSKKRNKSAHFIDECMSRLIFCS